MKRIEAVRTLGQYRDAMLLAQEIAEIHRQVQPECHWETQNAIRFVEMLVHVVSRPSNEQAKLAKADASAQKVYQAHYAGRYREALVLANEQLETRRRVFGGDNQETLAWMDRVSYYFQFLGRSAEAEATLREALAIRENLLGLQHPEVAMARNALAWSLDAQRKSEEAEPIFQSARQSLHDQLGSEHPQTLDATINLAMARAKLGRTLEAEELLQETLAICRRLDRDEHRILSTMNSLAVVLQHSGKLAKSESLLRESLKWQNQAPNPNTRQLLNTKANLAIVLADQGRLAEAERLHRELIEAHRQAFGDTDPGTLRAISGLGSILLKSLRYEDAEPLLRQVLNMRRLVLGPEHKDTLITASNWAVLLNAQGRLAEAERHHRETLEVRSRTLGVEHPHTLHSMNNLAWVLTRTGDLAGAEDLSRRALQIRRDKLGENHPDTLWSVNAVAHVLAEQGRLSVAENLYRDVINRRRVVLGENHIATLVSTNGLASVLHRKGHYEEAECVWARNAASFEVNRVRTSDRGLDRVYFAAERSPLLPLAACLARNSKPLDAWRRFEAHLARGLLDSMPTSALPLTPEESAAERGLSRQLVNLEDRRTALSAGRMTAARRKTIDELRRKRTTVEAELSQLWGQFKARYGPRAGTVYGLERVQSKIPEGTALLGWLDAPGRTGKLREHWACIIRDHGPPSWIELESVDKQLPRRLSSLLTDRRSSHRDRQAAIESVYRERLKPVERFLSGARNIVVIGAGEMSGVPVQALTQKYTISYAPSATIYAWLTEQRHSRPDPEPEPSRSLLVVGDPQFSRNPTGSATRSPPEPGVLIDRVSADSNASRNGLAAGDILLEYGKHKIYNEIDLQVISKPPEPGDPEKVTLKVWRDGDILDLSMDRGSLGIGVRPERADKAWHARRELETAVRSAVENTTLERLPWSRREATRVAGLFRLSKKPTKILLGPNATEEAMRELGLSGALGQFRFLHFATHGLMNDRSAWQSAIVLSQPARASGTDDPEAHLDGLLTADQIGRTWKLNAELVTMSACQTAVGKRVSGEGMLGFSQSLLVAGARSLVLTLWKVDDRATTLLMTRFYENILGKYAESRRCGDRLFSKGQNMPKAQALREAKAWLAELPPGEAEKLLQEYETEEPATSVAEGARGGLGTSPVKIGEKRTPHDYSHPYYWAAFVLIGDPE